MAQRVNDNNVQDLIELISEQGFEGMAEAAMMLMNEAATNLRRHECSTNNQFMRAY